MRREHCWQLWRAINYGFMNVRLRCVCWEGGQRSHNAQSQPSNQKTLSFNGAVLWVNLINFVVAGEKEQLTFIATGVFFIISHYSAFVPGTKCNIELRWCLRVNHLSAVMCSSCLAPSVTSALTLLLSFPLPSGTGATAWIRCWVHGNWVGIDWTAAWPTRGQWEPEDQSSTADCASHPSFCRKT